MLIRSAQPKYVVEPFYEELGCSEISDLLDFFWSFDYIIPNHVTILFRNEYFKIKVVAKSLTI